MMTYIPSWRALARTFGVRQWSVCRVTLRESPLGQHQSLSQFYSGQDLLPKIAP
jgi:hypothetical protein